MHTEMREIAPLVVCNIPYVHIKGGSRNPWYIGHACNFAEAILYVLHIKCIFYYMYILHITKITSMTLWRFPILVDFPFFRLCNRRDVIGHANQKLSRFQELKILDKCSLLCLIYYYLSVLYHEKIQKWETKNWFSGIFSARMG